MDVSTASILNQLTEIDAKIRQHAPSSSMTFHTLLHDPIVTVLGPVADRLSAIDQLVSVIFQTEQMTGSPSSSQQQQQQSSPAASQTSLALTDGRRRSKRMTDKVVIMDTAFVRLSDIFLKSTSLHLRLAVAVAFRRCRWALKYVINRVDVVRPIVEVLNGDRYDDLTRILALRILGYFAQFTISASDIAESGEELVGIVGRSFDSWFKYDIVFGVVERLADSDAEHDQQSLMVALQALEPLCSCSSQITQYSHPILLNLLSRCLPSSFDRDRVKLTLIYRVISKLHICEPGFNLELLNRCFKQRAHDQELCISLPYLVNLAVRDVVVLSQFIVENVIQLLVNDTIDRDLYDIAAKQLYKLSRLRPYSFTLQRLISMSTIVSKARFPSCVHVLRAIEYALDKVASSLPKSLETNNFISTLFIISRKCSEPGASHEFRIWGCRLMMKCHKLSLKQDDLKTVIYSVLNVLNSAEIFHDCEYKRTYLANMLAGILAVSGLNPLDVVTLFCNHLASNNSAYEYLFLIIGQYLRVAAKVNESIIGDLSRKVDGIKCKTYKMDAQKTELMFILSFKAGDNDGLTKVCSALVKLVHGKSLWLTYCLARSASRYSLHAIAVECYQLLLSESEIRGSTRAWFGILSLFSSALVSIQNTFESLSRPSGQSDHDGQFFQSIGALERIRNQDLKNFELFGGYLINLQSDYLEFLIVVFEYIHGIFVAVRLAATRPTPSHTRLILSKVKLVYQKVAQFQSALRSGVQCGEISEIMNFINQCQTSISRCERWDQEMMKRIISECRKIFKVPSLFFTLKFIES